jgi:hypothetical protein
MRLKQTDLKEIPTPIDKAALRVKFQARVGTMREPEGRRSFPPMKKAKRWNHFSLFPTFILPQADLSQFFPYKFLCFLVSYACIYLHESYSWKMSTVMV